MLVQISAILEVCKTISLHTCISCNSAMIICYVSQCLFHFSQETEQIPVPKFKGEGASTKHCSCYNSVSDVLNMYEFHLINVNF